MASVALLWAWSDESTLKERFENSRKNGLRLFSVTTGVAGGYQAFVKLLNHWTGPSSAWMAPGQGVEANARCATSLLLPNQNLDMMNQNRSRVLFIVGQTASTPILRHQVKVIAFILRRQRLKLFCEIH